jgi:hypothetical protein
VQYGQWLLKHRCQRHSSGKCHPWWLGQTLDSQQQQPPCKQPCRLIGRRLRSSQSFEWSDSSAQHNTCTGERKSACNEVLQTKKAHFPLSLEAATYSQKGGPWGIVMRVGSNDNYGYCGQHRRLQLAPIYAFCNLHCASARARKQEMHDNDSTGHSIAGEGKCRRVLKVPEVTGTAHRQKHQQSQSW